MIITIERPTPSRAKLVQYLLDMGWYQELPSETYDVKDGFENYADGKHYVELPIDEYCYEAYIEPIIECLAFKYRVDILDIYNTIWHTVV